MSDDTAVSAPKPIVYGVASALSPMVRRIVAENPGMMTGPGTNTYLVGIDEIAVIDPGPGEASHLDAIAGCGGDRIRWILLTHTHPDHVGALDVMRERLAVPLMAHAGPHFQDMALAADRTLADGDTIAVGQHTLRAYHAPGHIDDMLCFESVGGHQMIVGDTLFDGGPGHTWSAAAFATTLHTLRTVVLAWPDEMVCYPGHGPAFRLGDRRQADGGWTGGRGRGSGWRAALARAKAGQWSGQVASGEQRQRQQRAYRGGDGGSRETTHSWTPPSSASGRRRGLVHLIKRRPRSKRGALVALESTGS